MKCEIESENESLNPELSLDAFRLVSAMDPEVVILHLSPDEAKGKDFIVGAISSEFNRMKICDKVPQHDNDNQVAVELEDKIESSWTEKIVANPRIYNATKFRLHSIHNLPDGKVKLCLGITDYKEYLGTNWSKDVKLLQKRGSMLYRNSQVFLSDAAGVGAFVITKDDYVMLQKRSEHCAEAGSLWDVPGGHAEPSEIVGKKPLSEIDASTMDSERVVQEVFDSIIREVVDEVNIPREKLSAPLYMGTARNTTSGGRPSMEFQIRCCLNHKEVQDLYSQGLQAEAEESTSIRFVSLASIADLTSKQDGFWGEIAPSAKGCFTLYCLLNKLVSY